jgi:hypothetical protein
MIASFDNQNYQGAGLTEKQRAAALRILRHHQPFLSSALGNVDLQANLDNPVFKLPLRILKTVRKLSIVDHADHGRSVKLEFPFDEERIKKIKEQRDKITVTSWDSEQSAWFMSLEETTIRFLMDFVKDSDFEIDQELRDYFLQTEKIVENIENHLPMLVLKNKELKIANKPENLPELESKDVLSAVFEARKKGILIWDETVNQHTAMKTLSDPVREFLNHDYDHMTLIDSQKNTIDCLDDIVDHMTPCLFIIPGGNELEKISQAHDFLISRGIENSEISTMFRLPSETGADFNNFVKNNEINGPITEDTKIVFVSTKLPKSVIKSKIRFNCVINMGTHSAHHTVKEFMKNHENVVIFSELTKIKNIRDRQSWLLQGL